MSSPLRRALAAAALVPAALLAARCAGQRPSRDLDAGAAALTRQLAGAVERGDAPGVVALVVDRDRALYEGAAGRLGAGPAPMTTDAIFRIASMTKPITSVAIMMLVEEGRLRLDDPVSRYLPGFDHLQVLSRFDERSGSYEARPARRPITLRHLLTHTSGIGYAFSSPILARLQGAGQPLEWELPLLHDPGERWTYGASTRALGLVIEEVTRQPLEAWFQARIFQPLGMVDTSWAVPPEKQARVAAIWRRVDGRLVEAPPRAIPARPTPPFRGDGGLYSTARDYGRFVQMLLGGGRLGAARLLRETSVRAMGENQIGALVVEQQPAGLPELTRPFPLGAGRDGFGFGFQIAAGDAGPPRRRSAGSLSWAGLFNTEFWIDPRRRVGAVLLMQSLPFYDEGAIRTLRDFEALVYRHP